MQNYQIHLIGNGNLASSLAAHFAQSKMPFVHYKPDEAKRHFSVADLPSEQSMLLFAISDSEIVPLWEELSVVKTNHIYVHFSASIGLNLGTLLSQSVCLHPMYSFPSKKVVSLDNVPFSFQGEALYMNEVKMLFPQSKIMPMEIEHPEAYHMLGVFASNFQFALLSACEKLAVQNNISAAEVKNLILPIMKQTLTNYEASDRLYTALSGPVKRGDNTIVSKHQAVLEKLQPELKNLYKILSDELRKIS